MLECSVELGVPLNRRSRLAPAVAEDKIAGDHFSVVAGHRGGDESVPTSGRISTACALGQLACAGGLGGAVRGGIRCRRRRAAKAALQGARESLEGTGERASAWSGSAGEQGPEMGRDEGGRAACRLSARACKTCALGAPRARTAGARRNASVV